MNQFYNKCKRVRHSEFISESSQHSKVVMTPKEILKQVQDDVRFKIGNKGVQ